MSHLKYSFLLGNDHFGLRSPFCGGGPVLLARSCRAGPGTALGGTCPSHLPATGLWGPEGSRQPAPRPGTSRQPSSPPGAGWKLVRFRAATRCTPSFASGHKVRSRIGGKQPKRRKTCHPLHPTKVRPAPPQRAQGFRSGKPDSDFSSSRQTHCFLPAFSDQILGIPPPPPRVTVFHRKQKVRQVTRARPTSSRDCTCCNLACLRYTRRSRRKLQFVNGRWERLLRGGDNISETLMLIALLSAADFNSK
ncbi:uncharacterized protein ACIBXB_017581 [Morphnus guianensis]